MLIVANRSGCCPARNPDYPKSLNPEEYDSRLVKKFQEVGSQVKLAFTTDADLYGGAQIPLVLFHIGVVFSFSSTNAFPVFCLTDFKARLPESTTRKRK
jgi:hypothetical protein